MLDTRRCTSGTAVQSHLADIASWDGSDAAKIATRGEHRASQKPTPQAVVPRRSFGTPPEAVGGKI